MAGTRSDTHGDRCGEVGQNHLQPSKIEESNLSGHVSSFISDGVSPMGCQPTTVKKSPSVGAHRGYMQLEEAVPAQDGSGNAAPQVPSVLEPTSYRLAEGSASVKEFSRVDKLKCPIFSPSSAEQEDYMQLEGAVPPQEASGDAAPQVPSVAQTSRKCSVTGTAAEAFRKSPCTSESEAWRKTKELKKKLRKQRDFNRRLQRRLPRKRQALTIEEIVRSVRLHVSPTVAALLEAQLRMKNVDTFHGPRIVYSTMAIVSEDTVPSVTKCIYVTEGLYGKTFEAFILNCNLSNIIDFEEKLTTIEDFECMVETIDKIRCAGVVPQSKSTQV
ncbi:hypothetical protein HPB49_015121 [Dermacentor silvarum]|uniref:Uncharacterized protein n=1 Tax=Dermacentor silvarum TaxID=543639 RepID=A0ACB8C4B3_DERSI|nr:hypothetical protein HPB49_015121 [Dermacentor silvarum]